MATIENAIALAKMIDPMGSFTIKITQEDGSNTVLYELEGPMEVVNQAIAKMEAQIQPEVNNITSLELTDIEKQTIVATLEVELAQ